MPQPGQGLLIIERILRDRESIWRQVVQERGLKDLTINMLASSAIGLACYGLVLGASHGFLQALSSAVKLPLLFLATLAICLPTLYLFNLLFGARLLVMQAVTLIMVSITVTSVLALAFAPISLFFLISGQSYSFFKLLNVAILVLSAVVGLRFLTSGMASLNAHQQRLAAEEATFIEATEAEAPAEQLVPATVGAIEANGSGGSAQAAPEVTALPAAAAAVRSPQSTSSHPASGGPGSTVSGRPAASNSMTLLYIWIGLFGFVGTQLGWTLRPFFGSPGTPFALFRNIEGTFYGDIFSTIGRLFGG